MGFCFIVNASLFEFTRKYTSGRHEQQPISRIQRRRSLFISIISDITCCNQTKLPIFKRKFEDIKGVFRDRKLEKTNKRMHVSIATTAQIDPITAPITVETVTKI
jgi:Mg2+/Co2+ transporter CorB